MVRYLIPPNESLPPSRVGLNANVRLNEALQIAVGVPDDSTSIGSLPAALPTSPLAPTDSLRDAILKAAGIATAATGASGLTSASLLTDDDLQRTARDLGQNFNLEANEDSLIGTTFVSAGSPVEGQYPMGAGIYNIEVVRSGAAGGTAGRLLTVRASIGEANFTRSQVLGVWSAWSEVSGPAAQAFQRDIAIADWVESGDNYEIEIPATEHGLGPSVQPAYLGAQEFGVYEPVDVSAVTASIITGDITVRVTARPDNRFSGVLVLRGF